MRRLAVRTFAVLPVLAAVTALAQETRSRPEPSFVPGLYETESRNSAFGADDITSRRCLAAADYDAFRRETLATFRAAPQFKAVCRLSETREIADGFAFAMDCGEARTIVAYHFAQALVTSTTETRSLARPDYSSTILTLSRRIGDCADDKRSPQDERPAAPERPAGSSSDPPAGRA